MLYIYWHIRWCHTYMFHGIIHKYMFYDVIRNVCKFYMKPYYHSKWSRRNIQYNTVWVFIDITWSCIIIIYVLWNHSYILLKSFICLIWSHPQRDITFEVTRTYFMMYYVNTLGPAHIMTLCQMYKYILIYTVVIRVSDGMGRDQPACQMPRRMEDV